ncbi:DUF1539 domain-containing protein [Chlamydia crocodili]|uniref:DUF1539 domain-containing protein n=1 Tax=Chlamydia crocodili TaxID=2766982 RepID=A0ABX8CFE7_9CHLA|nr:DUF1539 domain-containing protein [Chlamydia crocodili]QVE49336.1 DUF1539 domain-containing protein [Chlamydia crocodili]
MSLEHNNFRAAFAPPPASALHETSFIKTANQKISFRSIFNALSTKLGSCLCLNPEFRSGAGWVFTFVLSAIITVLLSILLLPIKLILLGLSCCPCISRPTVTGEEIRVIPQLPPQTPPLSRRGSDSGISVGLDPSRFAPESFAPIPPQSPIRRPSVEDQVSIPSQFPAPSIGIAPEGITLRQYLQANYPERDLSDITLENLGVTFLQAEDLPQGIDILNLPASMFFPEEAPSPARSPQPSIIASQPASITSLAGDQTLPQQQDIASQPASLVVDTSAAAVSLGQEVDQALTTRDFLNRVYPNTDHRVLIHGARVNVGLQGIAVGESDEDILNLPALIAFPDLVAGQPARPTSLNLSDEPRSLASPPQVEPAPPPPTAEEVMSPNDPRYMFLQNNFPEISPEYYNQHVNLLASLAGIEIENFDLLQLPLEVFIATPAPAPDYEPISIQEAQGRFGDLSTEEYTRRNDEFIRNLIENSPRRWTFLNRLRNNITEATPSLTLRREWFTMLDVISKKTNPEIADQQIQDRARACLFKINSILKNTNVSSERKEEILKYIASYQNDSPTMWIEAMQQELALQRSLDPETVAIIEDSAGAGAGAAASIAPITQLFPPFNPQATAQEVQGYSQLLRNSLSRPVFSNMDNIHLAPTNDEYLESLMRDVPSSWTPIRDPLENCIAQITSNRTTRNQWTEILRLLSNGRQRSVHSEEAQALARATMFQLLKLLNDPAIPTDKKLSIINNVASYSDRCPPTWVRAAGQELQAMFNSNDTSTNTVFTWTQVFKENLLSEVFRDRSEWHMMTAFKQNHGGELGLDNAGIILDEYTLALAGRQYANTHQNYLRTFRNRYRGSGNAIVDSALEQALGGSEDQIQSLRDIVLADLTTAGIPEEHRADIMMEVFFPEENDYKPSREAIVYLLLKEGIITQNNNQ